MPDAWLRVSVKSPSDGQVDLLAEGLLACGGSAIEERDGELITFVPLDDEAAAITARVRSMLRALLGEQAPEFQCEHVPEQDWLAVWRAGLGPRRVGEQLVIAPTWSDVELASGEIEIRIDPQMAFGTGEHASTRGVLRLMQRVVRPGGRLLDVGTGSAILAIAAARLGAGQVVAVESDPEAMPNAEENVLRNGVADRVALLCRLVDDAFLAGYGGGVFDGILANVLSGVLRPLLPAFRDALCGDGWAILSGILVEEAADMRAAALASGFRIEAEDVEEQWWSVLLRRAGHESTARRRAVSSSASAPPTALRSASSSVAE
jgi:ribosomal protein L11 methyltransferase